MLFISGTHTRTGTACVKKFQHAQKKRSVEDFALYRNEPQYKTLGLMLLNFSQKSNYICFMGQLALEQKFWVSFS